MYYKLTIISEYLNAERKKVNNETHLTRFNYHKHNIYIYIEAHRPASFDERGRRRIRIESIIKVSIIV